LAARGAHHDKTQPLSLEVFPTSRSWAGATGTTHHGGECSDYHAGLTLCAGRLRMKYHMYIEMCERYDENDRNNFKSRKFAERARR